MDKNNYSYFNTVDEIPCSNQLYSIMTDTYGPEYLNNIGLPMSHLYSYNIYVIFAVSVTNRHSFIMKIQYGISSGVSVSPVAGSSGCTGNNTDFSTSIGTGSDADYDYDADSDFDYDVDAYAGTGVGAGDGSDSGIGVVSEVSSSVGAGAGVCAGFGFGAGSSSDTGVGVIYGAGTFADDDGVINGTGAGFGPGTGYGAVSEVGTSILLSVNGYLFYLIFWCIVFSFVAF